MKWDDADVVGGRRGGRRGRGRSAGDGRVTAEERRTVAAWFAGRLSQEWFPEAPAVTVDGDEILVVGRLPGVELPDGTGDGERATAEAARITGFREDTRDHRMRVAEEAQAAFGRVVSWGATCGGTALLFTTAGVPVMSRLRMGERQVLDTLIDAGVARSRSEALAWCVRLVGRNEESWITELRAAFEHVEQVRSRGPRSAGSADAR